MLALTTSLGQSALAQSGPHAPFEVTGKALKNHDGDTVKMQAVEHGLVVVRLSAAAPPKLAKPIGGSPETLCVAKLRDSLSPPGAISATAMTGRCATFRHAAKTRG